MSWHTVIRHQNVTARIKHEQLPEGRFPGELDNTTRTDIGCKLIISSGFRPCTGKSDKQLRIAFQQPSGKFDIASLRPTSQRQQVARVRIKQDEWRRTDA